MVVSQSKGTHYRPQNPIVYSPYYENPQAGTTNLGNPHIYIYTYTHAPTLEEGKRAALNPNILQTLNLTK